MWRRQLGIALVLLVAGLLWIYVSFPYVHWDGGFDLTVNVSSACGPVRSVTCQSFGNRNDAIEAMQHRLPERGRFSATDEPFTGSPLKVFVPVSGRDSMSGRQLDSGQFRYLAVIGECRDGRQFGTVVDIPDYQESHVVDVTFP
jgi:hypothetical protein